MIHKNKLIVINSFFFDEKVVSSESYRISTKHYKGSRLFVIEILYLKEHFEFMSKTCLFN